MVLTSILTIGNIIPVDRTSAEVAAMTKRLRNAAAKARRAKCHVKQIGPRTYASVTPAGHRYTVRCEDRAGQRYVVCNCAAGAACQPCYHIIGVALLDTAIHSMRAH